MAKDINIGGRLHSIATGNVVAGTDEILDDNLGKKQTQINTETYSLVESVNNALAELSPDQQEALGVAVKANANEAKLGYYVCDTDAAVAAKTIAATGYALTTGGNIRIKMTNANTADSATLNINSTGAKALFYNGTQASSTNSWEAGEVVEVYYNGTCFIASNLRKILDTIKEEYENGGVEIDLTSGTILQKSISGTTWRTSAYSSFIDMTEYAGQEISITANANYGINYAFTSSAKIGVNYSPVDNIVSGRATEIIPAGTTVTDIVPAGTSYLCLRRSSTSSAEDIDMLPESVMIGETSIDVSGGIILKAIMNFPTWTTGGQRSCSIIPIPYGGRTIEITANDTEQCTYAFFKDGTSGSNSAAVTNFAKNSMTSDIGAGNTVIKEIPANATHLYLYRADSSLTTDTTYMPKKVFVRNALKVNADSVRYSDYYNKDSNVQTVLKSVNMDICGVEVLDKSTFYDIGSDDIISPALLLYKGDTVNIIGNTNYSQHMPIVRWYDGYTITLVPRVLGATSYTYTATEDMYIRVSSNKNSTFTINRVNKRIDNIEMACHDIPSKLYLSELLGDARKSEYEIIHNKYINDALSIVDGVEGFYTNPVALKAGETIHLYCDYNGWSIAHLVKSDSEGNLISVVAKTITDTHYTYRAEEDCYIVASGVSSVSIIIVSSNKIQDYMDDYDARTIGTGILDLYANRKTENMLRQLNWGYNANNGGTGVVKPLCLLHFSDIHNNEVGESGSGADGVNNINRIVTFYNKYKKDGNSGFIHDIIHTGDCVVSNYGQGFPWTMSEDIAKILNVIGNHDLQGASDMVNVYNRYFAPYVEGWGVTLPENAAEEGRCYYYKDYTANKVRLITLMNWGWLGSTGTTQTYLASQKTWFQEVLEDAKTQGLTVVCAVHTHPANVTMLEGCSFNSWEYRYHGDVNGSQASTPVADSTNVGGYADDVQNFIDAGGDFACWICGHTHFDAVGPLSGFPDQFCIIIENAACKSYWCADHRITGTLSQDCFNVMSIDTYCKRVNVMRIGSNFASAVQHKGAFSYDYKNKKLLNCW